MWATVQPRTYVRIRVKGAPTESRLEVGETGPSRGPPRAAWEPPGAPRSATHPRGVFSGSLSAAVGLRMWRRSVRVTQSVKCHRALPSSSFYLRERPTFPNGAVPPFPRSRADFGLLTALKAVREAPRRPPPGWLPSPGLRVSPIPAVGRRLAANPRGHAAPGDQPPRHLHGRDVAASSVVPDGRGVEASAVARSARRASGSASDGRSGAPGAECGHGKAAGLRRLWRG